MNPPVPHFHQAVACGGEATIMSRHQQRDTLSPGEIEQQVKDCGTGALIEGACRLVG
jgi:hypothetical protein